MASFSINDTGYLIKQPIRANTDPDVRQNVTQPSSQSANDAQVCVCHSQRDTLGVHDVGLEAEHGKDHQCGQHRGEEVDEGDEHGVKMAVIISLVVAGKGDDAAEAQAQSEEDLRGCLSPHLGFQHDLQLRKHNTVYFRTLLYCARCSFLPGNLYVS